MTDDDRFAERVRRTFDVIGAAVPDTGDAADAEWPPVAAAAADLAPAGPGSHGPAGSRRWWLVAAAVLLVAGGVWLVARDGGSSTTVVAPGSTTPDTGPGTSTGGTASNDDPQAVVAEWQARIAGNTVAYTFQAGCFCEFNGVWFVVERDGEVLRSVFLAPTNGSPDPPADTPPPFVLSEALGFAASATGPVVVYDNTPTSLQLSVDSILEAIDDEFGFTMTDFQVVTGSPDDVPVPTVTSTTVPTAPEGWTPVLPPQTPAPTLEEIPRLAPKPLEGGGALARSIDPSTAAPAASAWLQVYTNTAGGWLHVETTATTAPVPAGETIGPWTATDLSTADSVVLQLATAEVTVTLWTTSLTMADLRDAAARMVQLPDGTWDLGTLPNTFRLVASGPNTLWTARRVVQHDQTGLVLALEVLPDAPSLLSTYVDQRAVEVDLDGTRAVYSEQPYGDGAVLATLVWEYAPHVVVRLGTVVQGGDGQQAVLDLARTVHELPPDVWEALPVVGDGDGCPAFWC